MKNILNIAIIIMALYSSSSAQCLVYAEEELAKYCQGTYLIHQELNNNVRDANLLLNKGNVYILYLLNPGHKKTQYNLINDFNKQGKCLHIINKSDNYQKYIIPADETIEHKISLNLQTEEKACVLMAVYLQDSLSDKHLGIYNFFEDFKQNNPTSGNITTLLEKKELETYFYTIADKEEKKKYGKIYGFCDGVNIYLNANELNPTLERNRFVKVEKIGNYYYYKTTQIIMVGYIVTPIVIEQLVDTKTGEVITLTRNTLKKIISDDTDLLKEFQSEDSKQSKLKEYLKKYSNRISTKR